LANHKSALKRHRQSVERRTRNRVMKSRVKNAVKGIYAAIEQKSDPEAVKAALKEAGSMLNRAASKGTIHKKNAARKISRLTRRVNAMAAAAQ
jgi:small subunit ribosomal protein S20